MRFDDDDENFQLAFFLMKVFVKPSLDCLSLREIISNVTTQFSRVYEFNKLLNSAAALNS